MSQQGAPGREFTWVEGLALGLSMIGVQLSSEVMNQWGAYFYSPSVGMGRTIYVAVGMVGLFFIIGTLWDAVTDPVIGAWSDRTRTKPGPWRLLPLPGRRRPFIFWGSLAMTVTAIAFWYPPVKATSTLNFVYGSVFLCLHWTMFTVTVVPLVSLPMEIARTEQGRVALGTFTAVGMVVGLAMAAVLPGILIVELDPARTEDRLAVHFTAKTPVHDQEQALRALLPPETARTFQLVNDGSGVQAVFRGIEDAERAAAMNGGVALSAPTQEDPHWNLVLRGAVLDELRGRFVRTEMVQVLEGLQASEVEMGEYSLRAVLPGEAEVLRGQVIQALSERFAGQVAPVEHEAGAAYLLSGALGKSLLEHGLEAAVAAAFEAGEAPPHQLTAVNGEPAIVFEGLEPAPLGKPFDAALLEQAVYRNLVIEDQGGQAEVVFYRDILEALNFEAMERRVQAAMGPLGQASLTQERGSFSPQGYRRLAWIMAFVSLLCFQLPVWLVRERYDSEEAGNTQAPLLEGIRDALANRAFVIYFCAFFLFSAGFMAAQRALPYWAELGLGGDESTVTILMIPFIVTALVSYAFIPALTRRLHTKWMMFCAFVIISVGMPWMYVIGVADLGFGLKAALGATLFAFCGIGQGIIYVMMTPMMGEIIDLDETRSGQRREALYNGLSGVTWKAAMGVSIFVATQSMHVWGNSVHDYTGVLLVGPIAGALGFLGMLLMLFYPPLHRDQSGPAQSPDPESGD